MATERIQRQIDRLLDEAEEAASQQEWATLRDRAQHVLTLAPQNEDALAFLAAAERGLAGAPSPGVVEKGHEEAPLPTSFASGRYQVKRFFNMNGIMSVVFFGFVAADVLLG